MSVTQTDPHHLLQTTFGWSEFKTGQLDVISKLLAGKSVLSVFPTGGGKSLCYQLPAIAFDGLTVVVSPLIALMKDQIDQLRQFNVPAARLDSSLTSEEFRNEMDSLRRGITKILYIAPERFFNERFRSSIESLKISLFAIDEAHCISQWGHNFRPDYLKLCAVAQKLNVERVLCLTATATEQVQRDICQTFQIADEDVVCTPFHRPNLHLRSCLAGDAPAQQLIAKIQEKPSAATIVYVTLQKTAETLAETINTAGCEARAYHAGMDPEVRNQIQEWFMQSPSPIVVATIAFGMGIDKSDIRYVYHFNPPKSIENYAQEIGRAGRDGKISQCEIIFNPGDQIVLENFVFGDSPSEPAVRAFIQEIDRQQPEFFVSTYKLSALCDIKPIVLKTLLTYLELDRYIESTAPRYDSYSFKAIVPSSEIIAQFEGERQQFTRQLLACSRKKKVWFHIDIAEATSKLGCERTRIVKALDYFHEKNWLELKASGLVLGYRQLKPFEDTESLIREFVQRIDQREKSEIGRTREVISLIAANECQSQQLSSHFDQPLDAGCGHCTFCIGEGDLPIPDPPTPELDEELLGKTKQLASSHRAVLNSNRVVARLLCGLSSPVLTRAKLTRHQLFGSCEKLPFDFVMQSIAPCNMFGTQAPPF